MRSVLTVSCFSYIFNFILQLLHLVPRFILSHVHIGVPLQFFNYSLTVAHFKIRLIVVIKGKLVNGYVFFMLFFILGVADRVLENVLDPIVNFWACFRVQLFIVSGLGQWQLKRVVLLFLRIIAAHLVAHFCFIIK